jgi:hypothetical protein
VDLEGGGRSLVEGRGGLPQPFVLSLCGNVANDAHLPLDPSVALQEPDPEARLARFSEVVEVEAVGQLFLEATFVVFLDLDPDPDWG